MSTRITPEEFLRALHDPTYALSLATSQLRAAATVLAVQSGYACPAPDCGRSYRHQHDAVWWPPEGEPWPPHRGGSVSE